MAIPLLDIEGTGAEIATRISDFADRRLHVIVLPASEPPVHTDSRPITDSLAEIAASVGAHRVEPLPADFTDQLDYYIYGTPKR
jgi:hypothetical protein